MKTTELESRYCPTCKRDEIVEVTNDVTRRADGKALKYPISAKCRLGHTVPVY